MELWQKILIAWGVFDALVFLYAWYDAKAEEIDLRGKWNAVMEAMTEEE